jgi:hypothetical protein
MAESPASAGIPTVISDSCDRLAQANDGAHQRHCPWQRPRRSVADDGVDDLVGATGVGEQFGEHRAQCNQDANARRGGAEAVTERVEDVADVLPRDDAHGQCTEDQREKRVQLGDRDQHDDQRDGGQRGQDELPARCDGFRQLGVGRQDGGCQPDF